MGFYEQIAKYYDYIFPTGKAQVDWIAEAAGNPPKHVLDIACGAGGYSIELAKRGYHVTAVDLDAQMVESLKAKLASTYLSVETMQGNMLELGSKFTANFYDLAFCIGNSLVHLDGEQEIAKFLSGVKGLLVSGGKLVLQIVNFDRILAKEVRSLPTIVNNDIGLTFQRMYDYRHETKKIAFQTKLEADGSVFENEVPLYPVQSEDLMRLLQRAGFGSVQLYGDFKGSEYERLNSSALVVVASS